MAETLPSVNLAECRVCQVAYRPSTMLCDRCQPPCESYSVAERHAIDLNLDHPGLLCVTVGVYRCIFQKPFVMSPNLTFLQNQRHESSCHCAPAVGTTLLPMRGSWPASPSGVVMKQAASPMGETGRVAAGRSLDGCQRQASTGWQTTACRARPLGVGKPRRCF